jgi:hypothetical protein
VAGGASPAARTGRLALALAGLLALALPACVQRSLTVTTDPPGARVFVNGKDRGPSPVTVPYVHEGRFDLRVEAEGYESAAVEVVTPTRADSVPGVDFFAEHFSRRSKRFPHHVALVPLKADSYTRAELEAMAERAEAFRTEVNRGAPGRPAGEAPRTPPPPPPATPPSPPTNPTPGAPPDRSSR